MSATEHLDGLALAINEGRPTVLLLGQDGWRSGARPDPLVEAALKRVGRSSDDALGEGFPALLGATPLAEEFYEWFADVCVGQIEAPWLETVACLPLNAVFTTSIDPALSRAFRTSGRDVEVVLSTADNPAAPRHRQSLHLTYLFGRAGERSATERPPRSKQELRRRTGQHASPLLSRVVETTTGLGVLLIDGFTCGRDWLADDALVNVLYGFAPGQVYWFGWDEDEVGPAGEFQEELAAPAGPVVFVRDRLSAALQSLELANKIDLTKQSRFVADDVITIGEGVLEVDSAIRLKTSTAASILDDGWLSPLPPLGPEAEYQEFRRFHGHSEDPRRLVSGMRRGFSVERTFEQELQERVGRALANRARTTEPILIHGQSGSGKSLALARLAFKIREQGRYPVLLASRANRVPAVNELDEFCLMAEEVGSEATLLVCDANAAEVRYRDLVRGFRSRGRRVVIVGSTYRMMDANEGVLPHLLEVPATLDNAELEALTEVFGAQTGHELRAKPSNYLLASVYRMLPDVRPQIAAGLAREARVAEDDLRSRGKAQRSPELKPNTVLGAALFDLGLVDPKKLLDQQLDHFLGSMSDAASKAIDYVMVPGKLDLPVPVTLLMRAVGGSENPIDIATLFVGLDLFRWSSSEDGDPYVQPRLQVEAELIASRRLGNSRAEAEVAIRLIENANPNTYDSAETKFVKSLVSRMGEKGPFGTRYKAHYLKIATALTAMRTRKGVLNPSLMLREANLRRWFLRQHQVGEHDDSELLAEVDRGEVLDEARNVVELALNEFVGSKSRGLRSICEKLRVEAASIYGFHAVQQLKSGTNLQEVWQFYEAARNATRRASRVADNYHAIDISVWLPDDLLQHGEWSEEKRAELVADIEDGLDRVDESQLPPYQLERYQERCFKVARTLDDSDLELHALEALEQMGSLAGVYLQARSVGGSLRGRGSAGDDDLSKATAVVSFMRGRFDKTRSDARCLRYLLRAEWLVATSTFLFGGERSPIPDRDDDLHKILELLDLLGGLEGSLGDPRMEYLRAVLLWRTRKEHAARDLWRALSQETAFADPRRIVSHHCWTEPGVQPRLFQGRVTRSDPRNKRVRVEVEEIRQEVELLLRDFPDLDLRRGTSVQGGFYIAFNYIGPVAEPTRRGKGGR